MKTAISYLLILFPFILQGQQTFQKTYGLSLNAAGSSANEVFIKKTLDNQLFLAGTVNVNGGDFFLAKLNSQGDTLWTKSYGGIFGDFLYSAIQTTDSGYVLGGYTSSFSMGSIDGLIIKTDKNGNVQWSKNYGGFNADLFSTVVQTKDGGLMACGTTFSYGFGIGDVYIIKMDFSGNIQWSKTFGSSGYDRGSSIQQTFDNGYIISGYTNSFTAASGRIYLIKTDTIGNVQWSQIFGGVMGEDSYCVRQCVDSGFVVTGYTNSFTAGGPDVFLLKTNINGALSWMKTYGGNDAEGGYSVEQTSDNGFILGCRTQGFGLGGGDYMIKTTPNGSLMWSKVYPSPICSGHYVNQTANGGYLFISDPNTFRLTKTDSIGVAGCNEFTPSTVVTTASPVVTSGINFSNGATVANASIAAVHTSIPITTICSSTTGVNNIIDDYSGLEIYPNPFSRNTTIKVNASFKKLNCVVFSSVGKKVLELNSSNTNMIELDRGNLPSGIYILKIEGDSEFIRTRKLIIAE